MKTSGEITKERISREVTILEQQVGLLQEAVRSDVLDVAQNVREPRSSPAQACERGTLRDSDIPGYRVVYHLFLAIIFGVLF